MNWHQVNSNQAVSRLSVEGGRVQPVILFAHFSAVSAALATAKIFFTIHDPYLRDQIEWGTAGILAASSEGLGLEEHWRVQAMQFVWICFDY